MIRRGLPVAEVRAVVVIEVDLPPERVEAVDLMEHVDTADVGVGAEAEAFREAGRFRGVGAQLDDVRGGEGDRVDASESRPGFVDGGAGFLAEDRGRVGGDERAVSFDF